MEKQTLANKLTQARDSLTDDNWRKGAYFRFDHVTGTMCMCAHGAVQAIVNPTYTGILNVMRVGLSNVRLEASIAGAATNAKGRVNREERRLGVSQLTEEKLLHFFNTRPISVRHNWINMGENYGTLDAHYLLGLVGLTTQFNDEPNTNLQMVKEKFDRAIRLADLIESSEAPQANIKLIM